MKNFPCSAAPVSDTGPVMLSVAADALNGRDPEGRK